MAANTRRVGRDECRAPHVPADLEPLDLDGLQDHDGWSERAVTGSAIAADVEHVIFARCRIRGVRFTAARLYKADLTDVVLVDCDLSGAVFEQLVLDRVEFVGCRLSGADLGGANLKDVRFTDCQLDELGLRMARTERLVVTGGSAAQIDLYRAWLTASTWHRVDLTGAQLSGARMERSHLHGSTIAEVRGAKALAGSVIDPSQTVAVGLALIADAGIVVDD